MASLTCTLLLCLYLGSFASQEAALVDDSLPVDLFDDGIEDAALRLMQSHSSMTSGPRHVLSEAASELNDVNSFAQDSVEVARTTRQSRQTATGESERAAEKTAPQPQADEAVFPEPEAASAAGNAGGPEDDEEMTCKLEGLTPGVCAMAALARPAAGAEGHSDLDFQRPERLERALFAEVEAALKGTHSGFTAEHLAEVEKRIGSFFAALPKNEHGRLGHFTVRYAVHQFFVREHAWYIRSLNPVGEPQAPASPGEALRGQVPRHLQDLIEQQNGGKGLSLRELAALAATLEHLIQGDLGERLKATYKAHSLQHSEAASAEEVADVLKTFMAHFLSLEHRSGYALTPEQARRERNLIEDGYSGWQGVVSAVEQVLESRAQGDPAARLPFADALSAAKEVVREFEQVSVNDCLDIKRDLFALPNGTSGRVLLADMHKKAVDGTMLYAESTEYLRTLGALEESGSGSPSVLVPNYVYSPSNCLGTTSFFDMCCPNECEMLLDKLERGLEAPEATPAKVEALLAVAAKNRPLSPEARAGLEELGKRRDGRVPLHGLGFALWLHRAFPGECAKPRAEDFAGARGSDGAEEVPGVEREFQAVASIGAVTASKSELLVELQAADRPGLKSRANASKVVAASAEGDTATQELRGLAMKKIAGAGLKVAAGFDAASLAQTSLEPAIKDAAPMAESPTSDEGKVRI